MGHRRWYWAVAIAAILQPAWLKADAITLYNGGADRSLSFDFGLRAAVQSESFGAPSETSSSNAFDVENIEPMFDGSLSKYLKFDFNMDYSSNNSLQVMDAIGRFEFDDYLNVWVGRFLPPTDRANLYGPFYADAFEYPGVVSDYPNIFAGRDDGAAYWGQVNGGMFKWQVGAFNGRRGGFNRNDSLMGVGRLTLDLLDPEPGYYVSNTYYGTKKILALSVSGVSQSQGAGTDSVTTHFPYDYTPGSVGNLTSYNADLLFEYPLGDFGAPTLEGAYYDYYSGGGEGTPDGTASMALVGWLLPGGFLKPLARWQDFQAGSAVAMEAAPAEVSNTQLDLELDYIVHGDKEKYAFVYSNLRNGEGEVTGDKIELATQFVY